jgi:hypothetical protein
MSACPTAGAGIRAHLAASVQLTVQPGPQLVSRRKVLGTTVGSFGKKIGVEHKMDALHVRRWSFAFSFSERTEQLLTFCTDDVSGRKPRFTTQSVHKEVPPLD